jgi:hypothetical protein
MGVAAARHIRIWVSDNFVKIYDPVYDVRHPHKQYDIKPYNAPNDHNYP